MNYAVVLLCCALALLATRRALGRKHVARLPPGPKGLPILGSIFQAPSKLLFLKLVRWAEEYGPIYSYHLLGQPVIVLSTAKAAGDVLDRMSSKTSDRPRLIKLNDYLCRNNEFGFLPANETRAAHETLNINAVQAMRPMQEEEAQILVEGFLRHPEVSVTDHLHRFLSSIAWRAIYGHQSIPLEGPNPTAPLDESFKMFFRCVVPGGSIVDLFPFLNPLIARSKFLRRQSDRAYEEWTAFFVKAVSQPHVEGQPSFINNLKGNGSKLGMTSLHDCGWAGASLFLAAQDTTSTTLKWFFLAMLLFPEAATTARTELISVVGDRPPSFSDRQSLPQIEALLKEILRWRSPVPAGVAHCVTEDFTYGDYLIPKGAVILPSTWSICRDPLLYSDGDTFDPSRFIDEEGQVKPAQKEIHDEYLAFGHGRRVCVGKNLAINSLWISIAYLLWAFDFKKGCDVQGNEITPDAFAFVDHGTTVWPKEFPAVLVPRFPNLEERLKGRKVEVQTGA